MKNNDIIGIGVSWFNAGCRMKRKYDVRSGVILLVVMFAAYGGNGEEAIKIKSVLYGLMGENVMRKTVDGAYKAGFIERVKKGYYVITPLGLSIVADYWKHYNEYIEKYKARNL